MRPVDGLVAVTYRCNARCAMCNIWQAKPPEELRPEAYSALPASLTSLNLTGGEPFMRDDLPEIVGSVVDACPKANIIISTNGLLPDRIEEQIKRILSVASDIGVAVSLDGIGEMHDRIRGVKNAYETTMRSISLLKQLGVKGLRIAFTITPENVGHFSKVYELSKKEGAEFTCAITHASPHYFQITETLEPVDQTLLEREIGIVAKQELRSWSPKRWARAYFMAGLLAYARSGNRILPCHAASDFFFLDPAGSVYPCNVLDTELGNVRERSADAILDSPAATEARAAVRGCRECWMVCTARTAIRRRPFRVGGWVCAHKFLPGLKI